MAREGVLFHSEDQTTIRLVTHLDVSRQQVLEAVEVFRRVLSP